MSHEQTVTLVYVLNLMLFILGIGLITFKVLFYRDLASFKTSCRVAVGLMALLAVLAFIFYQDITKSIQAPNFVSVLVFFCALAIGDRNIQKAHVKFVDKNYAEAIELYEKMIARFPKKRDLYLYCGHAHLAMSHFEEVISVADRYLNQISYYEPILILKLHALLKLDRFEDVLIASEGRTAKHKEAEQLHLFRAEALQRLYKHDEALAELDRIKKPDLWSKLERIQLEMKVHQTEKAISDFHSLMQNLTDKLPKEQMAHLLTFSSSIRMKERKFETAIQELTNSHQLDSTASFPLINRALCRMLLGQFEDAKRDLDIAQELAKSVLERVYVMCAKSTYLWKTGDLPGALRLACEANETRPNSAEILSDLGLMQMLNGLNDEARDSLSKAIEIDSYSGDAYYYRYKLFEKMGLTELAAADKAKIEQWKYRPYFELP